MLSRGETRAGWRENLRSQTPGATIMKGDSGDLREEEEELEEEACHAWAFDTIGLLRADFALARIDSEEGAGAVYLLRHLTDKSCWRECSLTPVPQRRSGKLEKPTGLGEKLSFDQSQPDTTY